LLELVVQFHTRSAGSISNEGKLVGSYRPSPTTHKLMGVMAPVPAATMRSGSVGAAPGEVIRTGRIESTSAPGTSLRARKSKPSAT
jgi:hypothetical protein